MSGVLVRALGVCHGCVCALGEFVACSSTAWVLTRIWMMIYMMRVVLVCVRKTSFPFAFVAVSVGVGGVRTVTMVMVVMVLVVLMLLLFAVGYGLLMFFT